MLLSHDTAAFYRAPHVLTPSYTESIVNLRWLKPRGGTRAVMHP